MRETSQPQDNLSGRDTRRHAKVQLSSMLEILLPFHQEMSIARAWHDSSIKSCWTYHLALTVKETEYWLHPLRLYICSEDGSWLMKAVEELAAAIYIRARGLFDVDRNYGDRESGRVDRSVSFCEHRLWVTFFNAVSDDGTEGEEYEAPIDLVSDMLWPD